MLCEDPRLEKVGATCCAAFSTPTGAMEAKKKAGWTIGSYLWIDYCKWWWLYVMICNCRLLCMIIYTLYIYIYMIMSIWLYRWLYTYMILYMIMCIWIYTYIRLYIYIYVIELDNFRWFQMIEDDYIWSYIIYDHISLFENIWLNLKI